MLWKEMFFFFFCGFYGVFFAFGSLLAVSFCLMVVFFFLVVFHSSFYIMFLWCCWFCLRG